MDSTRRLRAIASEPLLHFLLIGLVVFLAYPGRGTSPPEPATLPVIVIPDQSVQQAAAQFTATWNRAPTAVEMQGLIDSLVRDEVLYREALALGLDQGDAVIRQRLRLKLEFIAEADAAALQPTEAQLQDWYAANAASLTRPGRASFLQLALPDGDSSGAATLARLAAGEGPQTLGQPSLLPAEIVDQPAETVDAMFGAGFFAAVADLPPGAWAGPVASAYGRHLVRLDGLTVPPPPPLAEVRDRATEMWRQDQATRLREAQYQALLARYDVRMDAPGE